MAAPYDIQPFASTHPAIDALFAREFAQKQEAAKEDIARRQIAASSDLAKAQLQHAYSQQDYANLFREREFQARQDAEKARQTQTDRYLKLYEGQVPDAEAERIKQINAAAKAAAARFKAAYDAEVEPRLTEARKKEKDGLLGWRGLRPGAEKAIDDNWDNPSYAPRIKIESDAWKRVMDKMAKDPELRVVVPDPKNRIFIPAQLDAKGNLVPFDFGTNAPPAPPPSPGATNNPAALGPAPPMTGGAGTNSWMNHTSPNWRSLFPSTKATTTPNEPAPTPGEPSVRHAAGQDYDVLLFPEDSAAIVRELPSFPEEQRSLAYKTFIRQLIDAGRAKRVPRIGGAQTPLVPSTGVRISPPPAILPTNPGTNAPPPGATNNPAALGPATATKAIRLGDGRTVVVSAQDYELLQQIPNPMDALEHWIDQGRAVVTPEAGLQLGQ